MRKIIKAVVPIILILSVLMSSVPVSAISFKSIRKNPDYQYGVDVSQWNGPQGIIDWAQLRKEGVEFAYIRIGTYHTYGGNLDAKFKMNVKGAVENGIEFGVYVYSYVYKKSDNKKCAQWVAKQLKSLGNYTKDTDTIPVAYDIEDEVQKNAVDYRRISKTYLTGSVKTFTSNIRKSGYIPVVYASESFLYDYLVLDSLQKDGLKIWCAQWPYYPDTTSVKTLLNGSDSDVWQFSGDAYGCDNIKIQGCVYDGNIVFQGMYDYSDEDSTVTAVGLKDSYKYSASGVKPKFSLYDGDTLLEKNKDYKVFYLNNKKIGKAKIKIVRYKDSKYFETKTFVFYITPVISGLKTETTEDEINISWNKIAGVSYYQIYEYDPSDGSYNRIDTTKTNSYCDYELEEGTDYKLKIRAVYQYEGKTIYGSFKSVSASTKYKKLTGITAESSSKGQVSISWKPKESSCEGYELECSTNPSFNNSVKRTINGIDKNSKLCKNLKSGKTYYFKVRSFNTVESGKKYSVDSNKVSTKVK